MPVAVTGDFLMGRPDISPANVALEMMKVASWFDANRSKVAATERELRGVFHEQSARACVSPLWFRMPVWTIGQDNSWRNQDMREFGVLMLDQDLRPMASGMRLASTASYITYYLAFHGRDQRPRMRMRRNQQACGSKGFVTEVALGLLAARGMDPGEVLDTLRAARAVDDYDGIVHRTATTYERLSLNDGIVDAVITFDGGSYVAGKLTLNGEYPEALAMSAKGRQLSDFVDHPAFRAAGIVISHGRRLRGKLRLYHAVRSMPIEEEARTRFGDRVV